MRSTTTVDDDEYLEILLTTIKRRTKNFASIVHQTRYFNRFLRETTFFRMRFWASPTGSIVEPTNSILYNNRRPTPRGRDVSLPLSQELYWSRVHCCKGIYRKATPNNKLVVRICPDSAMEIQPSPPSTASTGLDRGRLEMNVRIA